MKKSSNTRLWATKYIVICGMLIAVAVALRAVNISLSQNFRISFVFAPIALAGILLGPVAGACVGAIYDIIGATLMPIGPFMVGFTLSAALTGIIFGLMLHNKKITILRVVITMVIITTLIGVFLNTLWLNMLYKTPFLVLLVSRLPLEIFTCVLQIVVVYLLARLAKRFNI